MNDSPINDQLLDAVRSQESGGDPFAISKAGAQGPYQFMPGTAKQFGVNNPFNEQEARAGAKKALQHYYDKYGSVDKALAAYNAGEGAVDSGKKLPKETRQYVKSISGKIEEDPFAKYVPSQEPSAPTPSTRRTDLSRAGQAQQSGPTLASLITGQQQAGLSDYLIDQFKQGLKETLAGGAPPEVLKKVGVQGIPELQPRNIPQPLNAAGQPTKGAQYAGAIARFAGAGLVPSGRAVALANGKTIATAVETLGTISSAMLSEEVKDWVGTWHKELGMTQKQAENIGAIIGALGGPTLVAKLGQMAQKTGNLGIVQDLASRLSRAKDKAVASFGGEKAKQAATARAEQAGAAEVSGRVKEQMAMHPSAPQNLEEEMHLRDQIPGWQTGIARGSEAPALLGQQHSMMSTSPEHLAMGAEEESRLRSSLARFQEAKFPAGKTRAEDVIQNRINAQDRKLRQYAMEGVRPDQTTSGQAMQRILDEQYATRMQQSERNYTDWHAEGKRLGYNPSTANIYNSTSQIAGRDANAWIDKSPVVAKILRDYSPIKVGKATAVPKISLEKWHSLYKRLGREIGKAEAENSSQSRALLETLRPIQHSMYKQIEGEMAGKGNLEQLFRSANDYHQRYIIQDFRQGAIGKVRDANKFGASTQPSEMVRKIWKNPEGVEQYFNAAGDHPQARKVYMDGVRDIFMREVAKNGIINPSEAQKWLLKNDRKLSLTPELKIELSNRTRASDAVIQRRDELVRQQKMLDRDNLLKSFKGQDPDIVVGKAMSSREGLQSLANTVRGNEEASKSLARQISTNLTKIPNARDFLLANEKTLKPIMDSLGPNHWNNLKTIASAEHKIGLIKTPTTVTPPGEEGFIKRLTGVEAPSFLTRVLGLGNIRGSEAYRTLFLGSKFAFKITEESRQKALEATFFNPDITAILAKMEKEGPTQKGINELKNHLLAHGVRIISGAPQAAAEEDRRAQQRARQIGGY